MAREHIVITTQDKFGGKQRFAIEKVHPECEEQHIHIFELVRVGDRTLAINHVRLHGKEFNGRTWLQTGFNRVAVQQVLARYHKSLRAAKEVAETR